MRISYENEISKPPEFVFPWIAEPEKAMQWQKNVKGGEILVEEPEIVGTTFTEMLEEGSSTLEMTGRITEYIENERMGFHLESRIHAFDVTYSLEEIRSGTRISIDLTIRWKFPLNIVSLFMGNRMKADLVGELEEEVLELKRICDSD